jgi:hypothetical protein
MNLVQNKQTMGTDGQRLIGATLADFDQPLLRVPLGLGGFGWIGQKLPVSHHHLLGQIILRCHAPNLPKSGQPRQVESDSGFVTP